MKNILKYISVFSAAATLFVGCTKDLEQVTYNPADASAAVLAAIDASYTLSADLQDDVALTFMWSEPDFGYSAAATNNLEFDVEGNDFAGASTLTSINLGGEYAVTHSTLNSAIMKLLDSYSMEYLATDLEFRVTSTISDFSTPLYSNVVSATFVPYLGSKIYPSIPLRGDYNGWDYYNSQKLYSPNEDGTYEGMIYFNGAAANGWKLCEDEGWSNNWGLSGGETAEQTSFTMSAGGDNITIYSGNSYYFTFDSSTLELTMSSPHTSWGVVGSHNDWGGSTDNEMSMVNSDNTYYLRAEVEFEAGAEWKIRPDNTWGEDIGCSAVDVDAAYCTDGGNFTIPEAGTYAINWYFNAVDQVVEVVKLNSSSPAVLNSLNSSYVLTEESAAESTLAMSWSAADLSTTMTVVNQIEMDVVGQDFATACVIGSVEGTEFSTTQEELNVAITNLLNGYSMEIVECELEFRIYSYSSDPASVPTYSNSVSTKVTPYVKVLAGDDAANDEGYEGPDNSAYSSIALRGDYSDNGWAFDQSQKLYSVNGDSYYSGIVFLNGRGANGWKLCADADWTQNWGLAGTEESEALSWTAVENGDNITIYSMNSYYFTFNSESAEFSMSAPHTSWGIVGSNNEWGGSIDTAMELGCIDNDYYLHATLEFSAGAEWKIRPDNTWGEDLGCTAVTVDEEFSTEGGNFIIPEEGLYTIRWYFNSVEQAVRVIKH